VFSFNYKIENDVSTMLDIEGFHTEFLNSIFKYAAKEHDGTDPIYRTLGITDPPTHPELDETPFVFVERGPGGHAPYGDFSGGATEYFEQYPNHTESQLKKDYERSIELDAQLFEERVDLLQSEGLLEDTLVIYTSDHGELLGEKGMIGHNSPMCPETVYVPTVFIHPDLPNEQITNDVISHVDLFPTILDLLNIKNNVTFDGQSILEDWTQEPVYTIYSTEFMSNKFPLTDGRLRYDGVWDSTGGYVFSESHLLKRLLVLAGKTYKSPKRHHLRRNISKVFREYVRGDYRYNGPNFSKKEAQRRLKELYEQPTIRLRQELSQVNTEQLEDLGYL
jgi:hypothetical protein